MLEMYPAQELYRGVSGFGWCPHHTTKWHIPMTASCYRYRSVYMNSDFYVVQFCAAGSTQIGLVHI
jgi:hypothetical protein